uniref:Cytochrome b5 reductase 4 n=1 Tax=Crocodylus porosus TaxID=8502 RepID=A0A7M4FGF5_CROPO
MLNVPVSAFPAPGSQQRAARGGRTKVPLKPGRSLMDWIRLTKSGKDLTGLKGRVIEVTEEELAKHNKTDDCWICIRGLVYNVTPYMEYHPGGEDELMKAAGTDGTDLFDQVHRWVNYESMLKECLVGRMALKPIALPKEKKCLNGKFRHGVGGQGMGEKNYDWFQTDYSVTVVVYTKQKDMNSELVILDYEDSRLRGEIIIRDYSYLLNIELSNAVQEDIAVHVAEKVGKVEIVLKKKDNIPWKKLGQPLESHNSFIKHTDRGLYYRKCKLISKTEVTHDTKLFCLLLPRSTHFQVPVGQHVYLKQIVTGKEIVKPYTPVSCSLQTHFKEPSCRDGACLFLMIKIYPSGLFSSELDHLQIGLPSQPPSHQLNPMHGVMSFGLWGLEIWWWGSTGSINLKLMFFNKTEDDILWRDQLEQLILQDKRFEAQFILSEPSKEWNGKRGKISSSLLSEFFKRSKQDSKVLICICGPAPFTEQGEQFLKDLDYCKEEIHSFTA